ncbi:polymorphic toxin-type HINT domain-containing protein [Actinomadura alba]|uniref:Hint domain-containing protein n=1 Tax=Actinomadura alba TaxID=406431 RepID=A0ABR7M2N4_9ACTN|nr:polymorphic toxin-type HINT domain-containing protein [Actinomadura alba]MBC6471368.1 hypothetical protein [Actinomadura alba]
MTRDTGKKQPSKPDGGGAGGASCPIGNSFTPETKVLMADGSTKPIEDVKVGDKVLATDPDTGKTTEREVVATIIGDGSKDLVEITVDTGREIKKAGAGNGPKQATKSARSGKAHDAGTGTVIATSGHPFWVADRHAWVGAGKLQPGMWLRTSAGTYVQVEAIRTWTAPQRVHNLTVTEDHTYYVEAGDTEVLVHNCGGQVRYGSTELSQATLEARVLDGAKSANTYAAALYEDAAGGLRTLVVNSNAAGQAEKNMVAQLGELGVSPSAVRQLYVEYQPCPRCDANWIPKFSNAKVTWSFAWNSDKAVQAAARKDRAAAINELWGQ